MKLRKIPISFIVLIFVSICSTEIVVRTPKAESDELLAAAAANIVTSCFGNKKLSIFTGGIFPGSFIKMISYRKLTSLMVWTGCYHWGDITTEITDFFVLAAKNPRQMRKALSDVYYSARYSSLAPILVIDWSPTSRYGCNSRSVKVLKDVAYDRMITPTILCLHSTKGIMLYTYNNYPVRAPAPWKSSVFPDKSPESKNFKRGLFFEREYTSNDICKNLFYDKVSNLDGGAITLNPFIPYLRKFEIDSSSIHRRTDLLTSAVINIITTFVRKVNGTLVTLPMSGIPVGYQLDEQDVTDMTIVFGYQNSRGPYPHLQMDMLMTTNFVGYKTQLNKIITLIDIYSRLGTCVVLLITLIFLKLIGQDLIPAFLNVLRITCATGFTNTLENNPSRLYRAGLYIFSVTMHGILMGKFASLLTSNVPVTHPQTVKDLVDSNYTIYCEGINSVLCRYPPYKGNFVKTSGNLGGHCIDRVIIEGSLTACVCFANELLDKVENARKYLYVSPIPVMTQYITVNTVYNWPFIQKFNKISMTIAEAGIVDTLDMRMARNKIIPDEFDEDGPRIMTVDNLLFAFIFWGYGLAIASLCFIVEVSIKPIRLSVEKARRRLSNRCRRIKTVKLKRRTVFVKTIQTGALDV